MRLATAAGARVLSARGSQLERDFGFGMAVHPHDHKTIYVTPLGMSRTVPDGKVAVYRSKDGGARWERVLHVNNDAGAVDLVMDPTNPRVLYAASGAPTRGPLRSSRTSCPFTTSTRGIMGAGLQ